MSGDIEAQQALATLNANKLKQELNARAWGDHMEDLLKSWGEKAAGLRFMHNKEATRWKSLSNKLTIWGILFTTISSTAALSTANIKGDIATPIMYSVGVLGLGSSLIQSMKKFYNADEKAAEHTAVSKQFGSFYRYMTLQLGMSRADRVPPEELSSWCLKEYERLQQESPPIGGGAIEEFKLAFSSKKQSVPDVAEDSFVITVHGRDEAAVKSSESFEQQL